MGGQRGRGLLAVGKPSDAGGEKVKVCKIYAGIACSDHVDVFKERVQPLFKGQKFDAATIDRLLAQRRFDLLVFRLDVLPLAPLYITRRHRIPYALKTLGQGMVNVLNEKGGLLGKSLVGVNRGMGARRADGRHAPPAHDDRRRRHQRPPLEGRRQPDGADGRRWLCAGDLSIPHPR